MTERSRHLEGVDWRPSSTRPTWRPGPSPPVAELVAEGGIEIPAGITFLAGENGSGKSTLAEALGIRRAESYDDVELVRSWRDFLAAPPRYRRHLLD